MSKTCCQLPGGGGSLRSTRGTEQKAKHVGRKTAEEDEEKQEREEMWTWVVYQQGKSR